MRRSLFLLILLLVSTIFANAAEYRTGPAPAWVEPIAVDTARKAPGGQSSGEWNILSDVQSRIEKNGRVNYYHFANKALDAEGVRSVADISFVFDPSYEQLTIHAIRIIRGGKVIDKLASAKISVLQRETELEYRIYDGSKTVSVVLDDLRVGDVVEYAYSRRGVNPVFGNRIAGGAELQWSVPVGQASVRLMVPIGRTVATQLMNSTLQPRVREFDGYRDYRWSQKDVPALKVDGDAPANYNPYARVRWSEFADWRSVVDWGLPLYRVNGQLDPALNAAIEGIRRTAATPEARVRAVLQLAQSDIRYLGVEVGTGSHAPTAPSTVFQRRFGDCKDKALLVVTMLRELNVKAVPALVNTERREAIADVLPAPQVFNHVVVRATLNGRHYWLDPTMSPQGGDLEHLVQSDFGLALVLDEGEAGLVKMAGKEGRSRKQVHAVFDGTGGPEQPMRYTITTVSHGTAADSLRDQIARKGVADLQSQFLNYYARRYPEIKSAAPLRHVDDVKQNLFTTVESYEIPDFWKRRTQDNRREAYIRSSEIRSELNAPDFLNRTAPLATNYPREIEEITEVKLSGKWGLKPEAVEIQDAAFEFTHKKERGEGDVKYRLVDHLRWLKPQVEPGEVREHAANLKKAYNEVGITLYLDDAPAAAARPSARTTHEQIQAEPDKARQAQQRSQLVQISILLATWGVLAILCWRSPETHRPLNWYLKGQLVWISFVLWVLFAGFDNTWKTQTLGLIIVFFGSSALLARSDRAPVTHWQYAHANPAAMDGMTLGVRYLVKTLSALPSLVLILCVGYYVKALAS